MSRLARLLAPVLLVVSLGGCALLSRGGDALVTREEWNARPAVGAMRPHTIRGIVVHHTAARRRPDRPLEEKLRALQAFSQAEAPLASGGMKPAWPDIPYHLYIDHAGRVAEGRDAAYAGDSNTAYDPAGHLLIVVEGNFEEEEPAPAQLRALRRLLAETAGRYGVPPSAITAHRDHAETLCPGRNLYARLPELRAAVERAAT